MSTLSPPKIISLDVSREWRLWVSLEATGIEAQQFLLHGVENARREWTLVCTAHNLNKLVSAWPNAQFGGA